jgi:anhydro-N-acetylmuramic acid kinase
LSGLYIGLMSGTSLDGVDGVLADFSCARPAVLGHCSLPLPPELKTELLALNSPGNNELHRAALAANSLVRVYAEVVESLLAQCDVDAHRVRAIGAHGQTVRHRPLEFDGTGYTLQLNQPALLAEMCGIDVVADFRSRDLAAGGQGAPLVPPFHQEFFGPTEAPLAVLNIGGISNTTLLNTLGANSVLGFDCGPGNALMDAWCLLHTGAPFDKDGHWASKGQIHAGLLARLRDEPFFAKAPPKSTGRDLFNMPWLQARLQGFGDLPGADVQATLTEFTASTCADSVLRFAPACRSLIVCGGGALNVHLMAGLQRSLPSCRVVSSEHHGLPPLQVEATAFAWLARKTLARETASLPNVTGARGARILGAIYPA